MTAVAADLDAEVVATGEQFPPSARSQLEDVARQGLALRCHARSIQIQKLDAVVRSDEQPVGVRDHHQAVDVAGIGRLPGKDKLAVRAGRRRDDDAASGGTGARAGAAGQ